MHLHQTCLFIRPRPCVCVRLSKIVCSSFFNGYRINIVRGWVYWVGLIAPSWTHTAPCYKMERPCNTLKIVSWTKKSFHFGLLVGFLVLSGTALRDLYSGTKTIQVNKIKQEFITNFPSFSVCSENFNITQKSLHNGVLNNEPFKVQAHTGFKYKSKKKWIIDIDMQNQSALMDHLDGEWDTFCKSFTMYTPACIPCLTFRFNSYKRQDVEKAYFAIHKTQNSIDEHGVLLTLHERNQSLLLHDSFDWSHTLYLQYRSGLKYVNCKKYKPR